MHALAALAPVTLGPDWMDPAYLLEQYGEAFFWISLAIVFIECGLLFPILPAWSPYGVRALAGTTALGGRSSP